jgi:hypothetical protein
MILLGLLWLLQEEVADTMIGTRYDFTLTPAAGGAPSRRVPSSTVPSSRAAS